MQRFTLLALAAAVFLQSSLPASNVFRKEGNPQATGWALHKGQLVEDADVPKQPAEEHYQQGLEAIRNEQWKDAVAQFRPVVGAYLGSAYGQDSLFYLAVAYYHLEEYEIANEKLTEYLEDQQDLKFFEEALKYKLACGEAFRNGAKKHLFGLKQMPKLTSGKKEAVKIYDEIITAAASSDIAAEALYAKGHLLLSVRQFREAVDSFVQLTQHFPKHDLCPKAYLAIGKTYHTQSELEHQNPDLLSLAEVNVQRFHNALPKHEGISEAEEDLQFMRECYARGLMETAEFYERTKRPKASAMYYFCAVKKFPETEVATTCRERLVGLKDCADELKLPLEEIL